MLNLKVIEDSPASGDPTRYNVRISSRWSELSRSTLTAILSETNSRLALNPANEVISTAGRGFEMF